MVQLSTTLGDVSGIIGMPRGTQVLYAPAHLANYLRNTYRTKSGICFHTAESYITSDPENVPAMFQEDLVNTPGGNRSYHYYVDARGYLWQLVPDGWTAQHVGGTPEGNGGIRPSWYPRQRFQYYNSNLLGISLQGRAASVATHVRPPETDHPADGGTVQFQTLAAVTALKCYQYGIPVTRDYFLTHHELDPSRRYDPGNDMPGTDGYFPMLELMDAVRKLLTKHYGVNPQPTVLDNQTPVQVGAVTASTSGSVYTSQRIRQPIPGHVLSDNSAQPGAASTSGIEIVKDGRLVPRYVQLEVGGEGSFSLKVRETQRIVFKVHHTQDTDPQAWTAEIYNLSERTESAVVQRGQTYQLYAGYGENYGLIADGEVLQFERLWRPPDRILKLTLGQFNAVRISGDAARGWFPNYGSTHLDVFRDLAAAAGLTLGSTAHLPELLESANFIWNGNAYTGLTTYAANRNFSMSIVAGVVHLERIAAPIRQVGTVDTFQHERAFITGDPVSGPAEAPQYATAAAGEDLVEEYRGGRLVTVARTDHLISEATGLIGYASRTDTGFKARLRLNNALFPSRRVTVQASGLSGRFVLTSVMHRGDTWGGDFDTAVEGVTV